MELPETGVAFVESRNAISSLSAQENEPGQLDGTADNDDDTVGNTTNQNGTLGSLFYSPCPVIYKPSKKYDEIVAKLIQMEDNGDFLEFDRYSSHAVEYFANTDPDIVAAVTVEQARCMLYRGKFKHAKRLATRGRELARHTSFPPMSLARAVCEVQEAEQIR